MAPLPTVDGFWIPTNSVSKQRRTHSHYCHRKRHQIAQYVVVFGGMRQLPIKVIRSVPNYRYKIGQKSQFPAGGTVQSLDVMCTITLDEVEGKGHLIVSSELDVRARAEGIDQAGLEQVARKADEGCTFSALIRASASVSVRAEIAS